MKNKLFSSLLTAVVGAVAFTSCTSEVLDDVNNPTKGAKQKMTFAAQLEDNVGSRTSLSGVNVLWSAGDAISVFDTQYNENNLFELTSGEGTAEANFTGDVATAKKYVALYPYQADAEISGMALCNVTIPTEQIATKNSFDPAANIMVAVSTDGTTFNFKNVCAYAKITTKTRCKAINISSSRPISGIIDSFYYPDPSTGNVGDEYEVNLVPSAGNKTFEAGTYYIAISSEVTGYQGHAISYTIKCVGEDMTIERTANTVGGNAFTRGRIVDLGTASIENGWTACLCPDDVHPHYVDLGLTSGTKWACMNIGATSPTDYGKYYAWGERTPQESNEYSWASYKHSNYDGVGSLGPNFYLTRYCDNPSQGDNGYSDTYKVLIKSDDAAAVLRDPESKTATPTVAQFEELKNECDWTWTEINGVKGCIVKSKVNNNSIFLPAAGWREKGDLKEFEGSGNYWTNKKTDYRDPSAPWTNYYNHNADCYWFINTAEVGCDPMERCDGLSVRAVLNN